MTGCFDKIVRVWNAMNRKVLDWQQTSNYITTLSFSENGEKLLVGLVNGDVIVYDANLSPKQLVTMANPSSPLTSQEKLTLVQIISCRNNRGKFSEGRKVTGIEFLSINLAMVTTNDNKIRFVDLRSGKVIYKLKGHRNESFPVRASIKDDLAYVVCGSEDGEVYLWSQIQSTVIAMSKKGVFGKLLTTDKSDVCEYFIPCKNG